MISIQELGSQILSHNPISFYVWVGSEYGIKSRYLDLLKEHYGTMLECPTVSSILSMMHTRHLIPLEPTLYVVRYDDEFISSLNEHVAKDIASTSIIGTIVCIYESDKAKTKCEKYLPNNVTSIDAVDPKFVTKYLISEFPDVPNSVAQFASLNSVNYSHARNMTRCISMLPTAYLAKLSNDELSSLFLVNRKFDESTFVSSIIRRDATSLCLLAETYDGQPDDLIYLMLRTALDLEKYKLRRPSDSVLITQVARWTMKDIYNIFGHCYAALKQIRSIASDAKPILTYLFSLLRFQSIPSLEDISWS